MARGGGGDVGGKARGHVGVDGATGVATHVAGCQHGLKHARRYIRYPLQQQQQQQRRDAQYDGPVHIPTLTRRHRFAFGRVLSDEAVGGGEMRGRGHRGG